MIRRGLLAVCFLLVVASAVYWGTAPSGHDASTASTEGSAAESIPAFSFTTAANRTGLVYHSKEASLTARGSISNSGVYVADFDNDRWPDLLTIGGDRPVLWRNDRGKFERSDALPQVNRTIRSALFFDYDNDGWIDLLLLAAEGAPVFLENRKGRYVRHKVGFPAFDTPLGATAADYNGDGCLDVFVFQNGPWGERIPRGHQENEVPVGGDNGNSNYLFEGNCSRFWNVTDGSGIQGTRWSLAASFVDLTGDGRPDIHVANDYNNDIVYVNRGDGTFEQVILGPATDRNGMSSEVADITRDGRLDVFVTNIFYPRWVAAELRETMMLRSHGNTLLVNRGNGSFVNRAETYGVEAGGWGWAAVLEDLDNDGDRDLFHATQQLSFRFTDRRFSANEIERIHNSYSFYRYPVIWERKAGNFTRLNPRPLGLSPSDGRGVAAVDFDLDGDIDLVLATSGGRFRLYENIGADNESLQVVVEGTRNIPALGAQVTIKAEERTLMRRVHANTDFLSQGSRTVHVGLGEVGDIKMAVTVVWPDGTRRRIEDVRSGYRIIVPPNGRVVSIPMNTSASDQ